MPFRGTTGELLRAVTGELLKAARLHRKQSQHDVARASGVTQASISNYENGKRDLPLAVMFNLCSALDMKPDSFVRGVMRGLDDAD